MLPSKVGRKKRLERLEKTGLGIQAELHASVSWSLISMVSKSEHADLKIFIYSPPFIVDLVINIGLTVLPGLLPVAV